MAQSPPLSNVSRRTRVQPPATAFPTLDNLKLPRQLVDGVTRSYQFMYGVRDQVTANSDAINHLVLYGTWQNHLDTAPTALPDGAIWFLTDYQNGIYQVRMDPKMNQLAWFYAAGIVWETAGVALAALDLQLGLNDVGFVNATGTSLRVWNGTQWLTLT